MKTERHSLIKRKLIVLFAGVSMLLGAGCESLRLNRPERISEFGKYQGYTEKKYDGYQRSSDFLTLSDGTRLAYDVYRPTKKGVLASKPYPALFIYTPYGRLWTIFDEQGNNNLAQLGGMAWYEDLVMRVRSWLAPKPDGKRVPAFFRDKWLGEMVKYGYVVLKVDRPGTGASFGKLDLSPQAGARETNEILNWIAEQPWCDGNIGMFGDSIQAQIQFQAASTGNPHLKAILPATTWWDNYSSVVYPGGIRNEAFLKFYAMANMTFDRLATPVDWDPKGELLAQARQERQGNALADLVTEEMPEVNFRDAVNIDGEKEWIEEQWLYTILDKINESGIPVYLIDGWFDIYARDDLVTYANLTVPKRLLIRPVDHSEIEGEGKDVDYGAEAHRWFDYWLKGIQNGIMDEPPIHYAIMRGDGTTTIYAATGVADIWPLKSQVVDRYYLVADDPSNHQGNLVSTIPLDTTVQPATYTVDYSTTSGEKSRWASPATPRKYPNMKTNDAKALTLTTPALAQAVQVTGHPVLHVWLSTQASDLDLFAYLEEVDSQGNSTYITEGCLRASNRAMGQAPYDNLGLPFRTFYRSDQRPIPAGEPFELVFDLLPTAYQFSPGKQIRIALTFSDAGNFTTPVLDPAPVVTLLQDADHLSYVDLPVAEKPLEANGLSDSPWVTLALFSLAAIALIVAGIGNKAPLGILLVIALLVISHRMGLSSLAQMGLVPPEHWQSTVVLGLLIGCGFSLLSIIVIQPLFETITGHPHVVSIVEAARGSWKGLLSWLVLIWTAAAFGEEILFRGFLMSQLATLLGTGALALVLNVLLTAIIFGLAHAYQGRSGTWSTGIMGACLGMCYILSGFNLWLPILVHGMANTVELVLMSRGADQPLRELIWKRPLPLAS